MFHDSDPRSTLTVERGTTPRPDPAGYGTPQLILPRRIPASVSTPAGSKAWFVRTASFLVAYYEMMAGDTLELLPASADRLVIAPHDDEQLHVQSMDSAPAAAVSGATILIVPGRATITAATNATVVEAAAWADLEAIPTAVNDAAYTDPMPRLTEPAVRRVRDLQTGIRSYPLAAYSPSPDRFGRMIVSSNVMANLLETEDGPRDVSRLSPHTHDDFEQCSITTRGRYLHHWRTPWTPALPDWQADQHVEYDSPGIAVIPPGVVHTANSLSKGPNQMLDLFAPPRADFIGKGWVLNAADGEVGPPS